MRHIPEIRQKFGHLVRKSKVLGKASSLDNGDHHRGSIMRQGVACSNLMELQPQSEDGMERKIRMYLKI